MSTTVALPGMVVPPVDPVTGAVEAYGGEYADPRVPTRIGRFTDDEREVHPLGHYNGAEALPGAECTCSVARRTRGGPHEPSCPCRPRPCAGERWGRQRHLFDVLHTHGAQAYDEDDRALPVEFHMTMTCVRCGLVLAMDGQADSAEDGGVRGVAQLDPAPLQAGELLAQQISRRHLWADEYEEKYLVYRDGQRVGTIASARGQRGRRYVTGRLTVVDGEPVSDTFPAAEGPTPLAVLRRLARLQAVATASVTG